MQNDSLPKLRGYGIAIVSVAVATAIRWVLINVYDNHAPFALFYLTILVTARFGGYRAAWLALALGLIPLMYFRVSVNGDAIVLEPHWRSDIGTYLFIGSVFVLLTKAQFSARHAAEQSEDRFRQLAEHITEVFWLVTCDVPRMLYASPGYERVWGRTCQSLYDEPRSFIEAIVPEDRERVVATLAAQRRGERTEAEYRIARPDGSIRWIWDRGFPIKDASGRVIRVAGIAEDVTERKQAEEALGESEERFRAIFDQANVGIVETDLGGRFVLVNDKYCEIAGYSREELLARKYQEITHPEDLQACMTLFERAVADKTSFTTDKRYVRKDGAIIWANTAVSPVRDQHGKPVYAVGIVQDISDRKRAEEAILAKQELLNQLYDSQENERRLVAFELHDGPIQNATAALMHLDAYKMSLPDKPAELELARYLLRKTLDESCRLMNGVRPPVLDEAGLVPAIEQLIIHEAAELPKVEFIKDLELGRFAPSLESAIYRIVQEGLTNARKHSQSDRVRITLGKRDGQVRLEIQDWGVGFQPSEVTQHRGGLKGFAERVRLAGGTLKFDSSPGNGTRIVVELPVLQAVPTS